jgi:hypothetical protein
MQFKNLTIKMLKSKPSNMTEKLKTFKGNSRTNRERENNSWLKFNTAIANGLQSLLYSLLIWLIRAKRLKEISSKSTIFWNNSEQWAINSKNWCPKEEITSQITSRKPSNKSSSTTSKIKSKTVIRWLKKLNNKLKKSKNK